VAERGRRHDHDSLHSRIPDERAKVTIDLRASNTGPFFDPPATHGNELGAGNIAEEMLQITAPVPPDSDKAYSNLWTDHRQGTL
jgi:hypothetical protein